MEQSFHSMLKFHHTRTEDPTGLVFEMHAHHDYELYYLVSGRGSFWVEGCEYVLAPGDLMLFNQSEVHHIEVRPDEPYERIVVNFKGELFDELPDRALLLAPFAEHAPGHGNRLRPGDFPDDYWKQCLLRMTEATEPRDLRLYCNLVPLCNEIRLAYGRNQPDSLRPETLPRQIIRYINDNLGSLTDVAQITAHFHISRTALYTMFKRVTGSSVWEYITVKRLLMARELLTGGIPPSQAFLRCGFRDYTTFFRAYKRQFGVSPGRDAHR